MNFAQKVVLYELEKVVLKGNLSYFRRQWLITPNGGVPQYDRRLFGQPVALNQSQATYQGRPWSCFLHHRAFRLAFDSN